MKIFIAKQWECPRCNFPENFTPTCTSCQYENKDIKQEIIKPEWYDGTKELMERSLLELMSGELEIEKMVRIILARIKRIADLEKNAAIAERNKYFLEYDQKLIESIAELKTKLKGLGVVKRNEINYSAASDRWYKARINPLEEEYN